MRRPSGTTSGLGSRREEISQAAAPLSPEDQAMLAEIRAKRRAVIQALARQAAHELWSEALAGQSRGE